MMEDEDENEDDDDEPKWEVISSTGKEWKGMKDYKGMNFQSSDPFEGNVIENQGERLRENLKENLIRRTKRGEDQLDHKRREGGKGIQ